MGTGPTSLADRIPKSMQVTCIRTNRTLDRSTFLRLVDIRADAIRGQVPLGPQRIVIANNDPIDCLINLFAVWQINGCAVMVNPDIKAKEQETVIATTGAVLWIDDDREIRLNPQPAQANDIKDAALILMTSGTTGVPKGVTHSMAGIIDRLEANLDAIGADVLENTLCTLPLFFGHGLIGNALTALYAGQHLYLWPKLQLAELTTFAATLDKYEITFFSSVPSFWRMVLATSDPPNQPIKRVHIGSAPLAIQLWSKICAWCGTQNVFNTYGMTETANWISGGAFCDDTKADGYVGRPWGGRFQVLRAGKLCDTGEGEIAVKSPGHMLGFWRDPAKTHSVMIDGYMLTGDLGHLTADQSLRLIGRTKNEINVAGIKVLAEEVDMLLESHPDIAEACSFGIPDQISGERVAAVARTTKASLTSQQLIQWCRETARADAVPFRIEIVDEIPKNDRGKIARMDIKDRMIAKWF